MLEKQRFYYVFIDLLLKHVNNHLFYYVFIDLGFKHGKWLGPPPALVLVRRQPPTVSFCVFLSLSTMRTLRSKLLLGVKQFWPAICTQSAWASLHFVWFLDPYPHSISTLYITQSPALSLSRSFTHSLSLSLTHPLTHPLTRPFPHSTRVDVTADVLRQTSAPQSATKNRRHGRRPATPHPKLQLMLIQET